MFKKIIWLLTFFWMGLIFFFSHQPADVSLRTSGTVLWKADLISQEKISSTEDRSVLKLQRIIRKWAHFIVYFILGVLITLSVTAYKYLSIKGYLIAWGICTFYGITDEIHQYFIPGRGPLVSDVILDSIGSLTGVFICLLIIEFIRWIQPDFFKKYRI